MADLFTRGTSPHGSLRNPRQGPPGKAHFSKIIGGKIIFGQGVLSNAARLGIGIVCASGVPALL